jgi:chitin disaccharide deacetylase
MLIVNADDWGRNERTTDLTLDCVACGAVSAVSAMVFMDDSERAAALARDNSIDAGLHLNFTTPFTSQRCPSRLLECQERVAKYLLAYRFSQVVFNPALRGAFEYVVSTQIDEFCRLYGAAPHRFDGHHHMHLSANVLVAGLLPKETIVRRNFSFEAGEKGWINRQYRGTVDRVLGRRYRLTDFFFSIVPMNSTDRMKRIAHLAERFVVEVETHPVNPDEYGFLTAGGFSRHQPTSSKAVLVCNGKS